MSKFLNLITWVRFDNEECAATTGRTGVNINQLTKSGVHVEQIEQTEQVVKSEVDVEQIKVISNSKVEQVEQELM